MVGLKKGQTNSGSFKKGNIPWHTGKPGAKKAWNKGKKCPQISKGLTGKKLSKEHREKAIKNLNIPVKGIKQVGQFYKNHKPWNKDLTGVMPKPWNKLEVRTPYPYEFNNKLKEEIRSRDNYECKLCFINQEELNEKLIVHHIDFDKKNNSESNLIALCRSCHGKVNCANKMLWINFFQNKQIKRFEVDKIGNLY